MKKSPGSAPRREGGRKSSLQISPEELDVLRMFVRTTLGHEGNLKKADIGRIHADFVQGTMTCDGLPVETSARELQLLHYLLSRRGEIVTRDDIFRQVWKFQTPPRSRSIDNYILVLRKKIEPDPSSPRFLRTLRGAGYKIV